MLGAKGANLRNRQWKKGPVRSNMHAPVNMEGGLQELRKTYVQSFLHHTSKEKDCIVLHFGGLANLHLAGTNPGTEVLLHFSLWPF